MSILPPHLSRNERRAAIKRLERDNLAAPEAMCEFLAQLYVEREGVLRLSVNRTSTADGERWEDGITWDELQAVKDQCGFADRWAVEIYPPADRVVNVANVRHLWLLAQAPAYAWRQA